MRCAEREITVRGRERELTRVTICEMRVHTKTIANNIVGDCGCRRCDE